jgi:hypothetical protein
MHVFNLKAEQAFDRTRQLEGILGWVSEGDVANACSEPGQTTPYDCHRNATEIYFCFEGGGKMRTPTRDNRYRAGIPCRPAAVPDPLRRGHGWPHKGGAKQPQLGTAPSGH